MIGKYSIIHVGIDWKGPFVEPYRRGSYVKCKNCNRKCSKEREIYKTCRTDGRFFECCWVCVHYDLQTNEKVRALYDLQSHLNFLKYKYESLRFTQ
jgi:hypothetical protein